MSDSFATEKERLLHAIVSFGAENNRLKAENEKLKEALEQIARLREINQNVRATLFSSCAEEGFCNLYCTMGDIAIKALSNAPDMDDGRKTETNGKKRVIVEVENSDGVKMVFTIPYIEETQEWVEYETNMPGWEKK